MYIELVRRVLEEAVKSHAENTKDSVNAVLARIRQHIDDTASEHRKIEPDIDYDDPLCRLGYLYRHAPAGATLFELVIRNSREVREKINAADKGVLRVCAVGGGPGTELLGIAKYLLCARTIVPRKIEFTVLDKVPYWAETWQQIAQAVEDELRSSISGVRVEPPTIAQSFLPLDVLKPAEYRNYAFQFRKADVVVFNYRFSENKTRLKTAAKAVEHLANTAPCGCVFVVIDRLEHNLKFTNDVVWLFTDAFISDIEVNEYDGTLDHDEQTSNMGEMLTAALGHPRVKFFTEGRRLPTVFWFAVAKRW